MVGAGLSKNANPTSSEIMSIPDWKELGDIFFKKLYQKRPDENVRYLNLLKVAEQIESTFGRPVLDSLLMNQIPDLKFEPSSLHNELLELPWRDVFTTNYDTLLERSVPLKHYDVVSGKFDLFHAKSPRIVKLHGSFPSPPFIITEEDYRRYPSDYAPFVNTVRQSLIENTLCLIGFSGDDPNFLQWIGWIRDNFGKETSSKIYLIDFHKEICLFEKRNIVPVDLSTIDTSYKTALESFLNYLSDNEPQTRKWPISSEETDLSSGEMEIEDCLDLLGKWRAQREKYPGWVVMPPNKTYQVMHDTYEVFAKLNPEVLSKSENSLDLEFVFELIWRMDLCHFPWVEVKLFDYFEEIATKYISKNIPISSELKNKIITDPVVDILLWLLRFYREQGRQNKWQEICNLIQKDFDKLPPVNRTRFQFEKVLQSIFIFKPDHAKQLLVNWHKNETQPFWEAKRAALLAELGENILAISILEDSLSTIRKQLGMKPILDDYTLISQESAVLCILRSLKKAEEYFQVNENSSHSNSKISKRLNFLAQYNCDPVRAREELAIQFLHAKEGQKEKSSANSFDLGVKNETHHFGWDRTTISAYGYLRMNEGYGFPYRIIHGALDYKRMEATLPLIGPYWPHWALVNIIRLGYEKAPDLLFNREYLSRLSREEVDERINTYIPAFERMLSKIEFLDGNEIKEFNSMAKTFPEVFSRLCTKCSPEFRNQMTYIILNIYNSKHGQEFKKVEKFVERLFRSMSIDELIQVLPDLIEFQEHDNIGKFPNFFTFIVIPKHINLKELLGSRLRITEQKIYQIFEQIKQEKINRNSWVTTTLCWLYVNDLLNKKQSDFLAKILWNNLANEGVPNNFDLKIITALYPNGIDPEVRIKDYFKSKIAQFGQTASVNDMEYLRDSRNYIRWTKDEVLELVPKLKSYFATIQDIPPFFENVVLIERRGVQAISELFDSLPQGNFTEGEKNVLIDLFEYLKQENIPSLGVKAATVEILKEQEKQNFIQEVLVAIQNKNVEVNIDAMYAVRLLAKKWNDCKSSTNFTIIGKRLVEGVKWRFQPALIFRLSVVRSLVEENHWFLTSEVIADICSGIKEIAEETKCGIKGNDDEGIILIRVEAAKLAFTLSKYHFESNIDNSEVINRWKAICEDPNEFSEVKNAWGF